MLDEFVGLSALIVRSVLLYFLHVRKPCFGTAIGTLASSRHPETSPFRIGFWSIFHNFSTEYSFRRRIFFLYVDFLQNDRFVDPIQNPVSAKIRQLVAEPQTHKKHISSKHSTFRNGPLDAQSFSHDDVLMPFEPPYHLNMLNCNLYKAETYFGSLSVLSLWHQ